MSDATTVGSETLSVQRDEVFLRWALMQRATLRRQAQCRPELIWLETTEGQTDEHEPSGRQLVQALGGQVWRFDSYHDMYGALQE